MVKFQHAKKLTLTLKGPVVGQMLFNIFISDMDKGMNKMMINFADDTKLFRLVKIREECEELQGELTKLG